MILVVLSNYRAPGGFYAGMVSFVHRVMPSAEPSSKYICVGCFQSASCPLGVPCDMGALTGVTCHGHLLQV